MRVSIALATFNGDKYLEEQLESFSRQSRLPDEIVLSDDGSTDSTVEVIKKFAAAHKIFKVVLNINKDTLGYAGNFNRALEMCSGDIIFLSDQDDVWYSNKIESVLDIFSRHSRVGLVVHDLMFCDSQLKPTGETKMERMERSFELKKNYVVGMATAVRRDLLDLCLPIPYSESYNHDDWLHLCANLLDKKFILRNTLADYRRHGENTTHGTALNSLNRISLFEQLNQLKKATFKPNHLNSLHVTERKVTVLLEWFVKHSNDFQRDFGLSEAEINRQTNVLLAILENAKYRCKIVQHKLLIRAIEVLLFCFRGGYNSFSGLKSALRDIVH